jgi:hypothetical protein
MFFFWRKKCSISICEYNYRQQGVLYLLGTTRKRLPCPSWLQVIKIKFHSNKNNCLRYNHLGTSADQVLTLFTELPCMVFYIYALFGSVQDLYSLVVPIIYIESFKLFFVLAHWHKRLSPFVGSIITRPTPRRSGTGTQFDFHCLGIIFNVQKLILGQRLRSAPSSTPWFQVVCQPNWNPSMFCQR